MSEAQRCASVMRRYGLNYDQYSIEAGCYESTARELERQESTIAAQAAEIARLRTTMQMVLNANPREWQELAERPSEFERWAKSRLNHALLPQEATHADR